MEYDDTEKVVQLKARIAKQLGWDTSEEVMWSPFGSSFIDHLMAALLLEAWAPTHMLR